MRGGGKEMERPRSYVYFFEEGELSEIELPRPLGISHWRSIRGALEKAVVKRWNVERLLAELDERARRRGLRFVVATNAVNEAKGYRIIDYEIIWEHPMGHEYRFCFKICVVNERIVDYALEPWIAIKVSDRKMLRKILSWCS